MMVMMMMVVLMTINRDVSLEVIQFPFQSGLDALYH
jgi:hypothetical protein